MKINKFIDLTQLDQVVQAPAAEPIVEAAEPEVLAPEHVDSVIFPASDRFKHMMSLIHRDDKELYNRIIGLE
jgi:hypothetical protein